MSFKMIVTVVALFCLFSCLPRGVAGQALGPELYIGTGDALYSFCVGCAGVAPLNLENDGEWLSVLPSGALLSINTGYDIISASGITYKRSQFVRTDSPAATPWNPVLLHSASVNEDLGPAFHDPLTNMVYFLETDIKGSSNVTSIYYIRSFNLATGASTKTWLNTSSLPYSYIEPNKGLVVNENVAYFSQFSKIFSCPLHTTSDGFCNATVYSPTPKLGTQFMTLTAGPGPQGEPQLYWVEARSTPTLMFYVIRSPFVNSSNFVSVLNFTEGPDFPIIYDFQAFDVIDASTFYYSCVVCPDSPYIIKVGGNGPTPISGFQDFQSPQMAVKSGKETCECPVVPSTASSLGPWSSWSILFSLVLLAAAAGASSC